MFEKFTEKYYDKHKKEVPPRVSITKSGIIYLNVAMVRQFNLKRYKSTNLLIDKDTGRIRLQLLGEQPDDTSLKLFIYTNQSSGSYAKISATSFLKYYDINYDTTRRFEVRRIQDNILEFKIPTELIGGE